VQDADFCTFANSELNMKQKSTIGIIGCGWLGLPLAKALIEAGHTVHGSSTTKDKLAVLALEGIRPFLVAITAEGIKGQLQSCLLNCKVLILNIPPGLRKDPSKEYVKQMQQVLPYIENSSVEHLLFISSTSVYENGAQLPIITEDSPFSTEITAQKLVATEALFQNNLSFKTTILRLSGLLGPNRHPATYLSGRTHLKNPEAPVNLIHRADVIGIIKTILSEGLWDTHFNASYPSHPTKKAFYTQACEKLNLPLPQFDEHSKSTGKRIASEKLIQHLKYAFQHPI